jgi:hypothetical protein
MIDWLERSAAMSGLGGMRRLRRGLVKKPKTIVLNRTTMTVLVIMIALIRNSV